MWLAFLPIVFIYGSVVLTWVFRRALGRHRQLPEPASHPLRDLFEARHQEVNQLDYTFVRGCSDEKVLERILQVLRSGEEGIYPHFIEYVEEKLAKVNPDSRLLLRPEKALRLQDLSRSELATLEADLSEWAADLKKEEKEKRSGGGKEEKNKRNEEEEDEEKVDSDDDEIEKEEEGEEKDKEEEKEEEEEGGERTLSPPLLTPTDLPPLDNIGKSGRPLSRVKRDQKSSYPLSKVRTGKNSPRSFIQDITVDQDVKMPVSYPLNKVMRTKRSPGSLIEVIDDHESQGSASRSAGADVDVTLGQGSVSRSAGADVKVMVDQEAQESAVITHKSSGSVIKVEGAPSRQVEALLREAERQQAEGDLLSASLNYNKVLSLCPQQVEARRALSDLLNREDPPAEPPAKLLPLSTGHGGSFGSVPLVQEVE